MASEREPTGGRATRASGEGLIRTVTLAVAATFLLVGVLGFVPGITTHYSDLGLAGHGSMAKLLGVFQVSVLHNLVHLGFGLVGLAMARTPGGARTYLVGGGIVYFVVWAYGLFTGDAHGAANFIPLNSADNWLHLALAFGMVGLGTLLGHRESGRAPAR